MPMVRTSVTLEPKHYQWVKEQARRQRRSVSWLINEYIRYVMRLTDERLTIDSQEEQDGGMDGRTD